MFLSTLDTCNTCIWTFLSTLLHAQKLGGGGVGGGYPVPLGLIGNLNWDGRGLGTKGLGTGLDNRAADLYLQVRFVHH